MRRNYLLPILIFVPLIIILYVLSQLEITNSAPIIALIIASYLVINIAYSTIKGTFHVSILVELSLVSLIAYFVLTTLT